MVIIFCISCVYPLPCVGEATTQAALGVEHAAAYMHRYKSEVGQKKILFRGSFGTQKPGGARSNAFDIFMKNAANTNVIHWRGRLLALFESAQPVAMDPYSLKTLGPDLLGGSVKAGASFDFGPSANAVAGTCLPLQVCMARLLQSCIENACCAA